MSVTAVVGGQFGSEGKGLIVGHIAKDYRHHVRVGAANAGHTLYTRGEIDQEWAEHEMAACGSVDHLGWEKHVMQQIPCAAYANPDAALYIGPGALIKRSIFDRELGDLIAWRRRCGLGPPKVLVDYRAHLITLEQVERETKSGLAERIGSTSTIAREGIGTAQADRVMRSEECYPIGRVMDAINRFGRFEIVDVPMYLSSCDEILLEGTQGAGLSLTTGYFPYVTSRNTTSAGLAADCGIAPGRLDRIILVCRTFPIRVAGPSGPFHPSSKEIQWSDLGVDPDTERTTVTKNVRRVATFSLEQVVEAVVLNGATEIALTFCDYLEPRIAGEHGSRDEDDIRTVAPLVWELIANIQTYTGLPVTMLGTGPHHVVDLRSR